MTGSIPAAQLGAARRRPIPTWGWIAVFAGGLLVFVPLALVIMAFFGVPRVERRFATSDKARFDLVVLESAAKEYSIAHLGRWPSSLEDLATPDETGRSYLEPARVPLDPWGRAYCFDPRDTLEGSPHIYTLGRDGVEGGEGLDEDLHNWFLGEPREDR